MRKEKRIDHRTVVRISEQSETKSYTLRLEDDAGDGVGIAVRSKDAAEEIFNLICKNAIYIKAPKKNIKKSSGIFPHCTKTPNDMAIKVANKNGHDEIVKLLLQNKQK